MFCFLGAWIIFFLIVFPRSWQQAFLKVIEKFKWSDRTIGVMCRYGWKFGERPSDVIKAIGISMVVQTSAMMAFFVLTKNFVKYHGNTLAENSKFFLEYNWDLGFTFMPVGFLSTSIPLAPAGLGVGHAVFDSLFSFFGIKNGASLFNLYFLGTVLFALLGLIPYFFRGRNAVEKRSIVGEASLENPIFLEKSLSEKINS
jgi:uncharacterized membrane protein YbhN (UPF0104 family)